MGPVDPSNPNFPLIVRAMSEPRKRGSTGPPGRNGGGSIALLALLALLAVAAIAIARCASG